jgi:hypothetical protein
MSNDNTYIDSISIKEIVYELKAQSYYGSIWISLDGPCTGMWVSQIIKELNLMKSVFSNILVDSCTEQYGMSDWLVYITRLI